MKSQKIFSEYNKSLLRELVVTDFKLRYQGSWLGFLWSVLKPLAMFTVLYIVFSQFLRFGDAIPNYPVYLLIGVIFFSFFTETTSAGLKSIVDRESIVRKVNLPKFIIVLSVSFSAFINLLINMVVVLAMMVFTGVEFSLGILLVPFLIIELFALALGLAFILSALYVKFRDLEHIWEVVTQVTFYATPIIYPISIVYENYSQAVGKLLMLNPLSQIIHDVRYLMITDKSDTTFKLVEMPFALIPYLFVPLLLIVAALYFSRVSASFAEEL